MGRMRCRPLFHLEERPWKQKTMDPLLRSKDRIRECYQECGECSLQAVSCDTAKIFNQCDLQREGLCTFFAAGSVASDFACSRRFWSLAWFLAFFALREISSRFNLFLMDEGSNRVIGIMTGGSLQERIFSFGQDY